MEVGLAALEWSLTAGLGAFSLSGLDLRGLMARTLEIDLGVLEDGLSLLAGVLEEAEE